MAFEICEKRQSIIDANEHALVVGGPGSGKTTLALLKCKTLIPELAPGQGILFLSFSRAAVQQILRRCKEILSKEEMKCIDVRTYHSFCWDVLHSHGGLLGGKRLSMMSPSDEGALRTQFDGNWTDESRRLFEQDGRVCFDLFASAVKDLFERSNHLRDWMGRLFPLVILDEFQDSDDEQWGFVRQLCDVTQTLFLADTEQRIFEGSFRPGVRADRLDILKSNVAIKEVDLVDENYRSADSEILAYANAVLSGTGPLPKTSDVKRLLYSYAGENFRSSVHFAVAATLGELRKRGKEQPTVAVLARGNELIAEISDALQVSHNFKGREWKPIPHDIVWDQVLSATAGEAIASALEFKSEPNQATRRMMHFKIKAYFLVKKDFCERYGGRGASTAGDRVSRFELAINCLDEGKALRAGSPKILEKALFDAATLIGEPVADWKLVRAAFSSHAGLRGIFQDARMVRLYRASDALSSSLSNLWVSQANYVGAARVLKAVLDQERLMGMDRDPEGVTLMTIHKSKGKEFDGVVLVEGLHSSPFFMAHEAPAYSASRRLLRVGISRARSFVVLVRPKKARALVDE